MSIVVRFSAAAAATAVALAVVAAVCFKQGSELAQDVTELRLTLQQVREIEGLHSDLKDADRGERGYLLTGLGLYLEPYTQALDSLQARMPRLRELTAGEPDIGPRTAEILALASEKLAEMKQMIATRQERGLDAARAVMGDDRGKVLMDEIRLVETNLVATLDRELVVERAAYDSAARGLVGALLFGLVAEVTVAMTSFLLIFRMLRRRLARLREAIARVSNDDTSSRIHFAPNTEFGEVAEAFNSLSDYLAAEREARHRAEIGLAGINLALEERTAELEAHSDALQLRNLTIDQLGRLAHRLPCCTDLREFTEVVECFMPQILPGMPGALFTAAESGRLLTQAASWGGQVTSASCFNTADCWALRRGKMHLVSRAGEDMSCPHVLSCAHVPPDGAVAHCCLPLVAQGTAVGLLYLEGLADPDERDIGMLGETIALALVNLRLRERLRSQSIRDDLTGLFNRRYLEEALEIEVARATRAGTPFTLIMLDIDHFKHFNDSFGHEAGDLVLHEIGGLLGRHIRKGDIACRFGGEEFAILLSGADVAAGADRAEEIRRAAEALTLTHRGRPLGPVTLSQGITMFHGGGETPRQLLSLADDALYAAKRAGRNRWHVAGHGEPPVPLQIEHTRSPAAGAQAAPPAHQALDHAH
jgi:diguanylate cyclase (GGDEF)-like protein